MALTHVALVGSERMLAQSAHALGPANPAQWLEVTVRLRRKKALELDGRPDKRITHDELMRDFGPSPDDIAKVKEVFERYGLKATEDSDAGTIKLAGTIDAMQQAFAVKLIRYAH